MRPLATALVCAALAACITGRSVEPERVTDPEVLAFAARIEGFYRALEGVPLDVEMTFDEPGFRSHFRSEAAFIDYYASLASQVRDAQYRNAKALRIEIRDFHFHSSTRARVNVTLVGRHLRILRFWEIERARTDTWQFLEGRWLLTPEKL